MRKLTAHSKTPLFLMEMILSLLILAVAAAACAQVFAASWQDRKSAREWNHIQELVICTSELLEGSDGSPDAFLEHLPQGTADGQTLTYCYGKDWNPCSGKAAVYQMVVNLNKNRQEKAMELSFIKTDNQETLYQINVQYPVLLKMED
ncbi:MAG: hypothetical protein ACOYBE_04355 [Blautia sp.]|jgi:hypothetical protein